MPDSRVLSKYIKDAEHAYVMQRYRNIHDYLHVLCGVPADFFGEVVLKYIEDVQTGLPATTAIAYGGFGYLTRGEWLSFLFYLDIICCYLSEPLWILFINLNCELAESLLAVNEHIPYARRAGRSAEFTMNVALEEEFKTPLAQLRQRLNVEVAPPFPAV